MRDTLQLFGSSEELVNYLDEFLPDDVHLEDVKEAMITLRAESMAEETIEFRSSASSENLRRKHPAAVRIVGTRRS